MRFRCCANFLEHFGSDDFIEILMNMATEIRNSLNMEHNFVNNRSNGHSMPTQNNYQHYGSEAKFSASQNYFLQESYNPNLNGYQIMSCQPSDRNLNLRSS